MKALFMILPLLLLSDAFGESRLPEFSGYSSIGKQHLFILTNPQTLESSGWITAGAVFQGYVIEDCDVEADILVLRYGTRRIRVPLKASRVIESQSRSKPRTTSSEVEGGSKLKMAMSRDGVFSLNGHAFPGETLDALFAVMARENEGLLLIIERQYPKEELPNRDTELLKQLMARMRNAGLKRGVINMTDAHEEASVK